MENKPNQLIVVGGGESVKSGLLLGLWNKLKDKFVLGTNYSYRYFTPTALCCVDRKFYEAEREKLNPLPLVLTRKSKRVTNYEPNTICLNTSNEYTRDLSKGVYSGVLTGIFSLSLAIHLLGEGEIFLLGYDWTSEKKTKNVIPNTHFYQGEINHRGIGKIDYYNSHRPNDSFRVYMNETKCKIYNVSPQSNILNFDKIDYPTFFDKLNNETYNQEELRNQIKIKLTSLKI